MIDFAKGRPEGAAPGKKLTPEARRALAEAAARRAERDAARAAEGPKPKEIGGPKGAAEGADPVRYGDWEKAGRAIDFS